MDANTHYTNEYHDDQVRRSNELEKKLEKADGIVDNGALSNNDINSIEFDPMTAICITLALKENDLSEIGRLFREAAIDYVVGTL